ncbi:MAG TPA: preprotein translocase subunit SecG [Acidimicrobiales bacterium]|jgi:preprotein translocase subunit SecG|nr:preprotein translocase subunit SecG [Acidimicrobiales bacterium]
MFAALFAALPFTQLIFWVGLIHVADSLLLIFLVLLHSGKGGGLSDMFGGSIGATAAGSTVVERNLDRITVIAALVFSFSTIGFALLLST